MLGGIPSELKNSTLIWLHLMVLGGFLEMSRHVIHFIYYQIPSAKYYHQCTERKSTEEVELFK